MKNIILIVLLFFTLGTFAQVADSVKIVKKNNIVFADILLGLGREERLNFAIGASLNLQYKKNLFTVRVLSLFNFDSWFLFIPLAINSTTETSLLYGRRYIYGGEAFSFSLGISHLTKNEFVGYNLPDARENYLGLPFEVNYTFFNNKKERFRILYGLVPVGNRTGFGRSIGFKFFGNLSKNSFFGIGVSTGLGWYKEY